MALRLWLAFLALWAASLAWNGAVSAAGTLALTIALALLYLVSLVALKEPAKLGRTATILLALLLGSFLVQLLPLPFLHPGAAALRRTHGVGALWPATSDAWYTLRTLAMTTSYALSGLLLLRLRQAGLSTSAVLGGLLAVTGVEAAYGIVQAFAGLKDVPFYGPRPAPDSASGTLVSRNNFAGLMAVGLVLAVARAFGRFSWPIRGGSDPNRPRWMRQLEGGGPWALLAALFAVALVLTKSRGGALAAAGGVALLPLFYRGRASAAGAAALGALAGAAVLLANPSGLLERFGLLDPFDLGADLRWTIARGAVRAGLEQPIFGFGWGSFPRAFGPFQPASLPGHVYHAHNEYANVFFEAGAIGLGLGLAALGVWFVRVWSAQKALPGPDRMPVTAALAGVATLAVHSVVDFDLRIPSIGVLWAALLGLGAAAVRDGVPRPTWPAAALALAAAAALAVVPQHGSLGFAPYDWRAAWTKAQESGDPARYEIAADLWPAHAELQRETGLTFWDNGDPARAARFLRRAFEQDPAAVEGVLDEIWRKELPLSAYEALLPSRPAAWGFYAGALAKRGLWQEASDAFQRGAGDDAAAYDLFAAKLGSAGQWGLEAVIRDKRLSIRSDPWAHAAAAGAWLRLGAHDRALERIVTAERVDGREARWTALRGDVLAAKGERLGAIEAYSAAIAKAPNEIEWQLRRGLLALGDKTWASAVADLKEVRRSRPGDRSAAIGLARALIGLEQSASARILLDEWLSRHPDDAEARGLRDGLRP